MVGGPPYFLLLMFLIGLSCNTLSLAQPRFWISEVYNNFYSFNDTFVEIYDGGLGNVTLSNINLELERQNKKYESVSLNDMITDKEGFVVLSLNNTNQAMRNILEKIQNETVNLKLTMTDKSNQTQIIDIFKKEKGWSDVISCFRNESAVNSIVLVGSKPSKGKINDCPLSPVRLDLVMFRKPFNLTVQFISHGIEKFPLTNHVINLFKNDTLVKMFPLEKYSTKNGKVNVTFPISQTFNVTSTYSINLELNINSELSVVLESLYFGAVPVPAVNLSHSFKTYPDKNPARWVSPVYLQLVPSQSPNFASCYCEVSTSTYNPFVSINNSASRTKMCQEKCNDLISMSVIPMISPKYGVYKYEPEDLSMSASATSLSATSASATSLSASATSLPATSASATSLPATSASATSLSATSASATSLPATSASATSLPATSASATSLSATSASATSLSATSASATSLPATSASATSLSATSASATSLPATSASPIASAISLSEDSTSFSAFLSTSLSETSESPSENPTSLSETSASPSEDSTSFSAFLSTSLSETSESPSENPTSLSETSASPSEYPTSSEAPASSSETSPTSASPSAMKMSDTTVPITDTTTIPSAAYSIVTSTTVVTDIKSSSHKEDYSTGSSSTIAQTTEPSTTLASTMKKTDSPTDLWKYTVFTDHSATTSNKPATSTSTITANTQRPRLTLYINEIKFGLHSYMENWIELKGEQSRQSVSSYALIHYNASNEQPTTCLLNKISKTTDKHSLLYINYNTPGAALLLHDLNSNGGLLQLVYRYANKSQDLIDCVAYQMEGTVLKTELVKKCTLHKVKQITQREYHRNWTIGRCNSKFEVLESSPNKINRCPSRSFSHPIYMKILKTSLSKNFETHFLASLVHKLSADIGCMLSTAFFLDFSANTSVADINIHAYLAAPDQTKLNALFMCYKTLFQKKPVELQIGSDTVSVYRCYNSSYVLPTNKAPVAISGMKKTLAIVIPLVVFFVCLIGGIIIYMRHKRKTLLSVLGIARYDADQDDLLVNMEDVGRLDTNFHNPTYSQLSVY